MALRERPLGILGIDLRVVEDAKFDGIELELLRHFVHGDLQRHQARRLAGRAHRIAFGRSRTASRMAVMRLAPA